MYVIWRCNLALSVYVKSLRFGPVMMENNTVSVEQLGAF